MSYRAARVSSFFTPLPKATVKTVRHVSPATSAITDVYTCPPDTRALFSTHSNLYNGGVSTSSFWPYIYTDGQYRQVLGPEFGGQGPLLAGGQWAGVGGGYFGAVDWVLEPGERVAWSFTGGGGVNGWWEVLEFSAQAPLFTARNWNVSVGYNLLYTCPAGKSAHLLSFFKTSGTAIGTVHHFNGAPGNVTMGCNVVPSGESPGAANSVNQFSQVPNWRGNINAAAGLGPGDSLYIYLDAASAAQYIFATLAEFDR